MPPQRASARRELPKSFLSTPRARNGQFTRLPSYVLRAQRQGAFVRHLRTQRARREALPRVRVRDDEVLSPQGALQWAARVLSRVQQACLDGVLAAPVQQHDGRGEQHGRVQPSRRPRLGRGLRVHRPVDTLYGRFCASR